MDRQGIKTECKNGHPFSADNTRIDLISGRRSCVECGRIRSREHQRKKRQAMKDGTWKCEDRSYLKDSEAYNRKFIDRLRSSSRVDETTGCWLWTRSTDLKGYGSVGYMGVTVHAYWAAYCLLAGPIPSGQQLDHLCRVRRCINPDHLEPVTPRENLLRGDTHAARNASKTHCSRGHEFTEGNLVQSALRQGDRVCRTCHLEWKRNRRRGSAGVATTLLSPSIGPQEVQP